MSTKHVTNHNFSDGIVYCGGRYRCVFIAVSPDVAPIQMLSFGEMKELRKLEIRVNRSKNKKTAYSFVLNEAPVGFSLPDLPGNFIRPVSLDCEGYWKMDCEQACVAMADSFKQIKLIRRKETHVLESCSVDYGSHLASFRYGPEGGGNLVFGYSENIHRDVMEKKEGTAASVCGLVGVEDSKGTVSHWENIVRSLASLDLPVSVLRLRAECMVGNLTTLHVDSFRGCTPNGMMTHDKGGRLCLRRIPEFKTSVVWYKGKHFVPFSVRSADNILRLIGEHPDKKDEVAWYHLNATVVNDLVPVGALNVIVVGMRGGRIATVPFCHDDIPPEGCRSCKNFKETSLKALVDLSRNQCFRYSQAYLSKEENKIYTLGEIPHKWFWFWGWRYMHWWDGSPAVRRTHIFMRFIGEVITGASMPGKNRFVVDWRD